VLLARRFFHCRSVIYDFDVLSFAKIGDNVFKSWLGIKH